MLEARLKHLPHAVVFRVVLSTFWCAVSENENEKKKNKTTCPAPAAAHTSNPPFPLPSARSRGAALEAEIAAAQVDVAETMTAAAAVPQEKQATKAGATVVRESRTPDAPRRRAAPPLY